MSEELVEYYRDLMRSTGLDVALCWSVVRGLSKPVTIEDVVRRMGGDPTTLRERPLAAAYDDYDPDAPLIHLAQPGPAVIVVENNGFQATRPEVLRELSTDAVVHNIYWQVNGHDRWAYAVWRKVLATVDLEFPENRSGDDPDCVASDLDPLLRSYDRPHRYAGLAAISLRTGVRLDADWLARPQLSFVATPLPSDPTPRSWVAWQEPDLYAWLMMADADRHGHVLARTLELLADRFGLSGGGLNHCVWLLARGERGSPELEEEAANLLQSFAPNPELDHSIPIEDNPPWQRLQARNAIESMTSEPGPPLGRHGDTFGFLHHARLAFGDTWPEVRATLLALARSS